MLGSGKPEPAECCLEPAQPGGTLATLMPAQHAAASIRTGILFHLLNQCEKGTPRALPLSFSLPKPAFIALTSAFGWEHTHTHTGAHTPFLQATAYFPAQQVTSRHGASSKPRAENRAELGTAHTMGATTPPTLLSASQPSAQWFSLLEIALQCSIESPF